MGFINEGGWDVNDELALVESGVGSLDGAGGDDLAVWSATRETQLDRLARGTYTDFSSFSLPKGIVGAGDGEWGTDFPDNEVDLEEDASSLVGAGGDALTVWSATRETQLDRLARGTYTDFSSFSLPKGIVGAGDGEWSTDFPENEVDLLEADAGSEVGAGGDDLVVWSADRETQLDRLARGTYTDFSSFSLPKGIVGAGDGEWSTDFPDNEVELSEWPGLDEIAVLVGQRLIINPYRVENVGESVGSRNIELKVGGETVDTSDSITLSAGQSRTGTLTTPDFAEDKKDQVVEVEVSSGDTSAFVPVRVR